MSYSTLYICSHPIKLTIEASCLIIYLFTIYLKKQNSKDICTEIFCLLEFSAQVPPSNQSWARQQPGARSLNQVHEPLSVAALQGTHEQGAASEAG